MAVVVGGGQQLGLGGGAHHHEGEHRELQHTAHTVSDNVYQMVCNGQVQAHLTCRHSRESFTSLHFSLPPSLHFFPFFSFSFSSFHFWIWIFLPRSSVFDEASCWEMKAQHSVPGYYMLLSCCCHELRFSSRRAFLYIGNDGEGQCMRSTSWSLSGPTPFRAKWLYPRYSLQVYTHELIWILTAINHGRKMRNQLLI